jgi:RimJ/RimL family protein N-acetyltransferase
MVRQNRTAQFDCLEVIEIMILRLKELKRIVCRCRPDHHFMCRVYIRVSFAHFSSLRSSRRTQNKRLHQHRIKASGGF